MLKKYLLATIIGLSFATEASFSEGSDYDAEPNIYFDDREGGYLAVEGAWESRFDPTGTITFDKIQCWISENLCFFTTTRVDNFHFQISIEQNSHRRSGISRTGSVFKIPNDIYPGKCGYWSEIEIDIETNTALKIVPEGLDCDSPGSDERSTQTARSMWSVARRSQQGRAEGKTNILSLDPTSPQSARTQYTSWPHAAENPDVIRIFESLVMQLAANDSAMTCLPEFCSLSRHEIVERYRSQRQELMEEDLSRKNVIELVKLGAYLRATRTDD